METNDLIQEIERPKARIAELEEAHKEALAEAYSEGHSDGVDFANDCQRENE